MATFNKKLDALIRVVWPLLGIVVPPNLFLLALIFR